MNIDEMIMAAYRLGMKDGFSRLKEKKVEEVLSLVGVPLKRPF